MKLGLMLDVGNPGGLDKIIEDVRSMANDGFPSVWMAQVFGPDALTTIALVGREVDGIELGTAVVPTYPRHPMMLAQQALTANAAIGGRLALGICLSHQIVIEGMWGYSFDKPARHMKEYLSALMPLLHEGQVTFEGDTIKAMGTVGIPGSTPPPVLLAALAPRMLQLAGGVADGTVTWMTGPKTVEGHIVPTITKAAADAGRPAPRVAVGLPVCVTDDPDGARERAAREFQIYGSLPSYRAMLDREGADGPADVAVVGDEKAVEAGLQAAVDAGATDVVAAAYGSTEDRDRTRQLLTSLL